MLLTICVICIPLEVIWLSYLQDEVIIFLILIYIHFDKRKMILLHGPGKGTYRDFFVRSIIVNCAFLLLFWVLGGLDGDVDYYLLRLGVKSLKYP